MNECGFLTACIQTVKALLNFVSAHLSRNRSGRGLIRFARNCGLSCGEWIAIDASKFRAVVSIDTVRERVALQRYLGQQALPALQHSNRRRYGTWLIVAHAVVLDASDSRFP